MKLKLAVAAVAFTVVLLTGCSAPPCLSFREAQIKAAEAGPRCRPSREYKGSPQARVTVQTTWLEPQRTTEQYFDCAGRPAVVYALDFGSEDQAKSKAQLVRSSLWIGSGPDSSHTDEVLVKGQVVVILSSPDPTDLRTVLASKGFEPSRS